MSFIDLIQTNDISEVRRRLINLLPNNDDLYYAVTRNRIEILEMFVEVMPDICQDTTPCLIAAVKRFPHMMFYLLSAGFRCTEAAIKIVVDNEDFDTLMCLHKHAVPISNTTKMFCKTRFN